MTADVKKNGYTVRTNKYKGDMFRPQPHLREGPKSRRLHPVTGGEFCIRKSRCVNKGKCDRCVPLYRLWKERS